MIIDLQVAIFTDRSQPPRELEAIATFTVDARADDFWGDFYAAIREARRVLAEAGQIDRNQDESDYPFSVVRVSSKGDSKPSEPARLLPHRPGTSSRGQRRRPK